MLVAFDIELSRLGATEGQQVHRRQIARGIVEEHVLRARVRAADRPRRRTGVPVVDGGVILQARIGAGPGGVADLLPQETGLQRLGDLAGLGAPGQVPVGVGFDRLEELVGDAHRVVRVLPRHSEIRIRVPIGVVDLEFDVGVALFGELNHALDEVVRDVILARGLDFAPQHRVFLRIEAIVARALAEHAGLHDRFEVLLIDLRARDEGRDLLLLDDLPLDELLDVGVVGVDDHHLRRAARGAARLDGARGAIADLQEAHQSRGLAAAGETLAFAAQPGEIRTRAGAVFEQAGLTDPQVHDAALVHQVVVDALDEAGVRLRMLVGRLRLDQLAGLEIDVEVALARAVDAIGPVQAGVEPLRAIGRRHLHGEHVDVLVEERARVLLAVEVAALPAPVGPGAGEPLEHLLRRLFADRALLLGQGLQGLMVRRRAPQP